MEQRRSSPTHARMAHPDLDDLLNTLVRVAQQALAARGEFSPFGASMTPDGQVVATAAVREGDELPLSHTQIDSMVRAFRQEAAAGRIRAAGVCFDVRVTPPGQTEKTDAICIGLEHESAPALDVFVPYKKGVLGGLEYGEVFAARRTAQFFVPNEGTA